MRLQKYMAKCGVASRRKSEKMIEDGLVEVNDEIIKEQGVKVDPNTDIVKVNGEIINLESDNVYIMLNKPTGYVTTMDDEKGRKIVIDLISGVDERIYPVGRLDMDTSGLILLTNDGKVTNKITHPRNEIHKTYVATIEGVPTKEELKSFRSGIILDGRKTASAKIKILKEDKEESVVQMQIREGRNRQIRMMCEAIDHPVIKLQRVSIGEINLGDLQIGSWRYLDKEEMKYVLSL